MPANYSMNAVLILVLGAVFLFGSGYYALFGNNRIMAFGMFAVAIGCICCGLTDGFTDPSPRGSLFKRLGAVGFVVGVPVLVYTVYKMV
jgi:hypothetical protein